jgi:hypothetical protein
MTNDLLVKLVADLEIADLERSRLYDAASADSEYLPACERHWAIREVINATPARTLLELRAKARAAEIALDLDAEAECEGDGSFVELSKSLISDLNPDSPCNSATLPPDSCRSLRPIPACPRMTGCS